MSLRRILKSGNNSGSSNALLNTPAKNRIWRVRFPKFTWEATSNGVSTRNRASFTVTKERAGVPATSTSSLSTTISPGMKVCQLIPPSGLMPLTSAFFGSYPSPRHTSFDNRIKFFPNGAK